MPSKLPNRKTPNKPTRFSSIFTSGKPSIIKRRLKSKVKYSEKSNAKFRIALEKI